VSEVSIGDDRVGEFSVSVSNITGMPLRVALRLVAAEPAGAHWFTISGEAEREFALGETESYTVRVQVPPDVAAGTYSVRCDAVAEAQPQEVFTIGPTVALAVHAPAQPRKFPWWIIAAAAGLVAVVGVVLFVVTRGGDDAAVPNVQNVAGSQAIGALNAAGFTTDPAVANVNPCDAPVATQETDGSTVTLTFAACAQNRRVPGLVNQRTSAVVANQARLGFAIEAIQSGEAAACDPPVTAQVPAPNTITNTGSTIVIVVPAEPAGCNIVSQLPPAADGRDGLFSGLAG
jgi:hypothetical protein